MAAHRRASRCSRGRAIKTHVLLHGKRLIDRFRALARRSTPTTRRRYAAAGRTARAHDPHDDDRQRARDRGDRARGRRVRGGDRAHAPRARPRARLRRDPAVGGVGPSRRAAAPGDRNGVPLGDARYAHRRRRLRRLSPRCRTARCSSSRDVSGKGLTAAVDTTFVRYAVARAGKRRARARADRHAGSTICTVARTARRSRSSHCSPESTTAATAPSRT